MMEFYLLVKLEKKTLIRIKNMFHALQFVKEHS